MFVVGTAGHVDHGKSALVRALTGIDPDRLEEEKQRGMTIDLGFAWLTLPSGREISIVDVPGHERFIKNMLAGVGGIDVALLVVAADEGVMPQTREHVAILDLLQVSQAVVALTKCDLADSEWLALVREDVASYLATTSLAGSAIVPCSVVTGDGLRGLVGALDGLLERTMPRRDIGRPRLSIDRAFTVAGFGTVVTGTLIDGTLTVGQEVDIVPVGRPGRPLRSRIRGLQTHKKKEEVARPGTRVAVNLTAVAVEDIRRGDVLTSPGWLEPTMLVDVRLRTIPELPQPLPYNMVVTVHTGAAEIEARVSLLAAETLAPGETTWAQLRLRGPLAVARGDFFVIRSPNATLGGGQIVDAHPRRHRRVHQPTLAALETLLRGTPQELIVQALAAAPPQEVSAVADKSGLNLEETQSALDQMLRQGEAMALTDSEIPLGARSLVVSRAGWQEVVRRTEQTLAAHHRQYPLRRGMPQEELKSRLGLSARVFGLTVGRLVADGIVVSDGNLLRLPSHAVRFSAQQQQAVDRFFARLVQSPFAPPSRNDIAAELGEEVLAALLDQGKLVKVREDVLFGVDTYRTMVDSVITRIKAQGRTNVAEVRDLFNTSRRYAIALLEHLDQERITRREGDDRVLNMAPQKPGH